MTYRGIVAVLAALSFAGAPRPQEPAQSMAHPHMTLEHDHGASGAAVSFAELETTVNQLRRARSATDKYHDVRVAIADEYRAIGPDAPGMGIHYVKHGHSTFDIEHPPILLYEKDAASPNGLRLVGVSYLLTAPASPDGQPMNPPFPPGLAAWHKHADICVFKDGTVATNLNAAECAQRAGSFTAETQWMVHAWIWKDSPAGVFSATNPRVQ